MKTTDLSARPALGAVPHCIHLPALALGAAGLLLGALAGRAGPGDGFSIQVRDAATGRGVPLVELRTVNEASWWTDSNGLVAFNEPGLMGLEVYFHVRSPGYEMPADGFGNRGVKLRTVPGGQAEIRLPRLNLAERLYRITGQGIYRDSVLAGRAVPLRLPVLNGQVMGQDTVIARPYRGKVYWFWGDTGQPSYPLGNFAASGATSELPGSGGLDPAVGVDLTYFVGPSGFSKPMCPLAEKGLSWIQALFTVRDERGRERLAARVARVPGLAPATAWHLMLFNDETEVFESVKRWDSHEDHNTGHPFAVRRQGTNYYYIFADWRVPADLTSLTDLSRYEAFTFLAGDGRWQEKRTRVRRDAAGHVEYAWRAGADRVHPGRLHELARAGQLKPEELWCCLRDYESGAALTRGLGSVAWNEFRGRWVTFFAKEPGDAWFAEADTPLGPWGYARRVLNHGDYNFYNLMHHPFFDRAGGRLVYFEGTYTATFAPAAARGTLTPRYDYNQLMYRLDLDDPRLRLPVPVYRVAGAAGQPRFQVREQVESSGAWERVEKVAWFALPAAPPAPGRVPVYLTPQSPAPLSTAPPGPESRPLFLGLPLVATEPVATLNGQWNLRVSELSNGEPLQVRVRMFQSRETVRVDGSGENLAGLGRFVGGRLSLTLTNADDQKVYRLEARLKAQTLEGQWHEQGKSTHGNWSATRADPLNPEHASPALAVLREYRRATGGGHDYAIENTPPPGCLPEGRPVCQVWKVPGTVLTLDWQAKPEPEQ